ncbi:MAG: hypothetical protein KatS3mg111_3528 [Pirellulaceae bacterium]|nr:MAG: hypothetical protein KatS3mg111_3528 [Pirellulaceae bacterium]
MERDSIAWYRAFRIVLVLAILTLIGILWFWLFEGWSLLDAAYMTVITLSTVGVPRSPSAEQRQPAVPDALFDRWVGDFSVRGSPAR